MQTTFLGQKIAGGTSVKIQQIIFLTKFGCMYPKRPFLMGLDVRKPVFGAQLSMEFQLLIKTKIPTTK